MTTKTNLVLLSVLAIATIGVLSMTSNDAHAISVFKWDMPRLHDFTSINSEILGNRSFATTNTELDEKGTAKVYAKNRSDIQNQVGVEWSKEITVVDGDTFVLTQTAEIAQLSFHRQLDDTDDSYASHFVAFPTVHVKGDRVGTVSNVWCDIADSVKFTENITDETIETTLVCNDIPAGTYLFSSYIHAFTNDEFINSSVYAKVVSVDLEVKRTR